MARFNRLRKQKIARRQRVRELRAAIEAAKTAKGARNRNAMNIPIPAASRVLRGSPMEFSACICDVLTEL